MKNIIAVSVIISMFAAASFAQNNASAEPKTQAPEVKKEAPVKAPADKMEKKEMKKESVSGEIANVDTQKNEITVKVVKKVKGKKEVEEKMFAVDPKMIAELKAGEKVKIILVNGEVKDIKKIKKEANKMVKKAEQKPDKAEQKPDKTEQKPAQTPSTN